MGGLGGRPITEAALRRVVDDGLEGRLERLQFLDLDRVATDRELARMAADRHSGPMAENMLRALGTARSSPSEPARR